MSFRPRSPIALAFIALVAVVAPGRSAPPEELSALDGEWVYVEDRTAGKAKEQWSPNMGPRVRYRVEKDAFIVVRSEGEIRMPLDGSSVDIVRSFGTSRYSGRWRDGTYVYESVPIRDGAPGKGLIRWTLRATAEGMLATVALDPPTGSESVCLFRHPKDIPLPKPAKATIADVSWLAGNWVGTRGTAGTTTIEERWGPPLGGAMLATSRTVSRGKMVAFEFLRVVERDGGLVYVAQPGGRPATEFVLTDMTTTRAVFENPRHDSPQRIAYELSAEGKLTASIGFTLGGRPQKFEFQREATGK